MSVKEIESAITQLPPAELARLAHWFEEFLAQAWDRQIEDDLQAGRLDRLIEQAEQEFQAGNFTPL